MSRALTPRERAVLTVMVDRAQCCTPDRSVQAADRARWRAQLETVRAGRPCGCGACPSVELTDAEGTTPPDSDDRVVLEAGTEGAVLLLFVDDDRLSYLELAPLGDEPFPEFPEAADIRTD